ncbi:MAG: hypothetical protein IH598_16110 [Bacteroidales bacterium]|nr:hypothetical protein [Bacteroidales bacterium]
MDEFVVDTNVPLIARGESHMSTDCELACARFIENFLRGRQILVIDDDFELIGEYMNQIPLSGPVNFANRFLKWLFENQGNSHRVKQVKINLYDSGSNEENLKGLLAINIDPSDLKFIAVAFANFGKAPIAEASDSKWIGWERALHDLGIKVDFLCKRELAEIFQKKMG